MTHDLDDDCGGERQNYVQKGIRQERGPVALGPAPDGEETARRRRASSGRGERQLKRRGLPITITSVEFCILFYIIYSNLFYTSNIMTFMNGQ